MGTAEVVTLFVEGAGLVSTLKVGVEPPVMVGYAVAVLVSLSKFQPAIMLAAGARGVAQ